MASVLCHHIERTERVQSDFPSHDSLNRPHTF